MSPENRVRLQYFSDIMPNLIVASYCFLEYNRVELRRGGKDMERKKRIYCALGGFLLGMLTASLIWSYLGRVPVGHAGEHQADVSAEASDGAPDVSPPSELGTSREEPAGSTVPESPADTRNSTAVYTGGDTVCYQGRRYQAKWWTQGEQPGGSDVWEDLGILDGQPV